MVFKLFVTRKEKRQPDSQYHNTDKPKPIQDLTATLDTFGL